MSSQPPRDKKQKSNLHKTLHGLLSWSGCGLVLLLVYSAGLYISDQNDGSFGRSLIFFSRAGLLAAASLSLGGFVGFLFGIPRTLQEDSRTVIAGASGGSVAEGYEGLGYEQRVNTSLEQISDWLTKIIVGVGLSQLANGKELITSLGNYLDDYLGVNPAFPVVLIFTFATCGFFAGYLLTRLFLAGALVGADKEARRLSLEERQAKSLEAAGKHAKASASLELLLQQTSTVMPKEVKRRLYGSLMYNDLYLDPPLSFQRALEHGQAYLQQDSEGSPQIWTYLAAAYGQQHQWEAIHEKRQSVLDSSRREALEAAKKAIALDPNQRRLLKMLWDPDDPSKFNSEENDLEPFFNDPDFKQLLDA
jgi:hypothetical protein